jgi:hypothetical protein
MSWLPVTRTIKLDEEIGLSKGSIIELRQFHPVERLIGRFKKGQSVDIEVLPFRSCLLIATSEKQHDPVIEGCDYEVLRDVAGKPVMIDLLAFPGEKKKINYNGPGKMAILDGKPMNDLIKGKTVEITFPGIPLKENYHRKIGDMISVPVPEDAESLYEATCFAADNNALEVRSLKRSGPSKIPQVQKARDAFFNQELFIDRGLWDHYLFDGDLTTSFYPSRRKGNIDFRINGGSLRLDMGELTNLDSINMFIGDEFGLQPFKSWEPLNVEVSADLKDWTQIIILAGKEITIPLDRNNPMRYLRLPGSPERVFEIEGYSNGIKVDRTHWSASDLFSPYLPIAARAAFQSSFVLNEIPKGSYLAVALNGKHGNEGAYVALRVNGIPVGAPDRSLSYRSNAWEYPVRKSDSDYTYYFPLTEGMKGAKIDAVVLVMKDGLSEFKPEVWITSYPIPYEKLVLKLN